MKKYVLFTALLFAFTFVSISVSAQAVASPMQSTSDYLSRQIMYDSMTMRNMNTYTRESVKSGGGMRAGGASSNRTATNKAASNKTVRAKVTFVSTGSLLTPARLAKKMGGNAETQRLGESNLTLMINEFNSTLKGAGIPTNDMAHATSSLFIACMFTYTGKDLTPKQKRGIYAAFKEYYETSEYFQSLTNKEKQENHELTAIIWGTVYVNSVTAAEKGDKASKKRAKDIAGTMMDEIIGAKINKIRLTDDGFEVVQ